MFVNNRPIRIIRWGSKGNFGNSLGKALNLSFKFHVLGRIAESGGAVIQFGKIMPLDFSSLCRKPFLVIMHNRNNKSLCIQVETKHFFSFTK